MQENIYTKDRLNGLGAEALAGLDCVCEDLSRLASGATTLKELFEIHRAVNAMGVSNINLMPDEYGIIRAQSLDQMNSRDIHLGNRHGVWTGTLDSFESARLSSPEAYTVVLDQYKSFLVSNINDIRVDVREARAAEDAEFRRTGLSAVFAKRQFPKRPGGVFVNDAPSGADRTVLVRKYAEASGVEAAGFDDLVGAETSVRSRVIAKMKQFGASRFSIDSDNFEGRIPVIRDGNRKYPVENVFLDRDGETLVVLGRSEDGSRIMVAYDPDGRINASVCKRGTNTWQNTYVPDSVRGQAFLANVFVNIQWQTDIAVRDSRLSPQQEKMSAEEALEKLAREYTAKDFRLLFPPRDRVQCSTSVTLKEKRFRFGDYEYETVGRPGQGQAEISKNRCLMHVYDISTGELSSIRMMMSSSWGETPDGPEMIFGSGRVLKEFRMNSTVPNTDNNVSSNTLVFKADGTIDREKTLLSEPSGDFILDYGGILSRLEAAREQARDISKMVTVCSGPNGSVARDENGFTFIDVSGRDLLNGLRMQDVSEPVNGVSVAQVDGRFMLVDMEKMRPIDLVLRPYCGSMTPDGWALIRDGYNMDRQEKYNYVNAAGEKLSVKGFDYATEFRDGKAQIFIGKTACVIDSEGVVTETKSLVSVKSQTLEERRGMHF